MISPTRASPPLSVDAVRAEAPGVAVHRCDRERHRDGRRRTADPIRERSARSNVPEPFEFAETLHFANGSSDPLSVFVWGHYVPNCRLTAQLVVTPSKDVYASPGRTG